MTDPSQYFKGRTVQEQMNEVIGYVDVRSAEVATNAIAADVAQVHQDMLDADADAAAAAASAAAAAGTLANAVKKTGEASQSIDGDIDLNDDLNVDGDATVGGALAVTGAITGDDATFTGVVTVPAPSNNTDAASKKYVDDLDANNVKITGTHKIGDYAVLLTGNQEKTGVLNFLSATASTNVSLRSTAGGLENAGTNTPRVAFYGTNQNTNVPELFGFIGSVANADGTTSIYVRVKNSNGTEKTVVIAKGDVI